MIPVFKHFIGVADNFDQEILIFLNALHDFLDMIFKIWKHFAMPSREERVVVFDSLKFSQ